MREFGGGGFFSSFILHLFLPAAAAAAAPRETGKRVGGRDWTGGGLIRFSQCVFD